MHFFFTYADIQISTKYESGIECACAGACAGAGACPCACPCIDGYKSRTYAIARDNTDNRFIHTTPSHCAFNNTSLIYPPIHRSIAPSLHTTSKERARIIQREVQRPPSRPKYRDRQVFILPHRYQVTLDPAFLATFLHNTPNAIQPIFACFSLFPFA